MEASETPASTSVDAGVVLVGCVSRKLTRAAPAKDLYCSELFRRRRAYAERRGPHSWLILSALHGLVDPEAVIEPYDVTLKAMSRREQVAWGRRVVEQLVARFGSLNGREFETHAGEEYARALEDLLRARGAQMTRPLRGLRIGEQLQWYGIQARKDAAGSVGMM